MSNGSIIDKLFTDGFNEANALYKASELFECIDLCYKLLDEPEIPRYHKMKTLVLLGATVGDWHEAKDCRVDAESLWKIGRRWHPEGEDETVDIYMAEIRESLDELNDALKEEQPSAFILQDAINELVDDEDERVADARAMLEDLDLEEDTPAVSTAPKPKGPIVPRPKSRTTPRARSSQKAKKPDSALTKPTATKSRKQSTPLSLAMPIPGTGQPALPTHPTNSKPSGPPKRPAWKY
ncbi:hypothetical protein OPT61_g4723 [Boeremia exigua]|uniref:Uncharacterized protein n=1 Tax=Boeremia exigua TaxID=749465 RepID=A0ACC2ID93_9PLEO|nr:hypothetical protein OPT61_g4723 [Boeremia exigua]